MAFTVEVIDRDAQTSLGSLTAPDIQPFTPAPRNGIGSASIDFLITDTNAQSYLTYADVAGLTREVKIKDGATVLFEGPVVGGFLPSLSGQRVSVQARTYEWYYSGIVVGPAERENLLTNGGFEAHATNLTGWTTVGTSSSIETSIINDGARAAKLDGAGHITQTVTGITHTYDPGLAPRLAFYVNVPQTVADAEGDGFIIARLVADNGTDTFTENITVGDVSRFGDYVRVSQDILLGADETWDIEIRLEGSATDPIYWDSGLFTFNDAITVGFPGDDLTVLWSNLNSHAQDTAMGKYDHGFTVDATPSGIVLLKGYTYSDHENIEDIRQELCREFNCDIYMVGREWKVEAKRGSADASLDRTITATTEAQFRALDELDIGLTVDPTQAFTSVIVVAEGPDFAKEEAGAVDASSFDGLIREYVHRADASAKVRDLQPMADALVAKLSRPPVLPAVQYRYSDVGIPSPGDTFDIDIDCFWVQMSGTYRVAGATVDLRNDLVTVAIDEDL